MNEERLLDISWSTIAKISVAVLAFYVLYLIRDILVWFLFALIISILFNPAVDFFHRRKVPRVLAALFIYVLVFGGLVLFLYLMATIFIGEVQEFSKSFPRYFEELSPLLQGVGVQAFANTETFIAAASRAVEQIGANIFTTLFVIFGGIFSGIFVISVAFFLSLEEKAVEKSLSIFFPKRYETAIVNIWGRAQKRVSGWFLSRILASLFVGVLSYLTFFVFDVRYPVTLALLSGILNFIPIVGPVITAVVIFAIVALDAPVMALVVIAAFTLIQMIESNILTPWLSRKFVGVSPALVLLSLAIGGKLWGLLGAILVIPLVGILSEFMHELLLKRRSVEEQEFNSEG